MSIASRATSIDATSAAVSSTSAAPRFSRALDEAIALARAGDGNDERLLADHPGKRNLREGAITRIGDVAHEIHKGLISIQGIRIELRHHHAVVLAVVLERALVGILAGEQPVRERAERHVADAQLLAYREQALVPSGHHGVPVLDGRKRRYRMCAADYVLAYLRKPPGKNLAL